MKMNKYILVVIAIFSFTSGFSQKAAIKEATREYKDYAFVKTTEILLKVAESGYKSEDMFQKLGDAYYFNNQMAEAAKWYGELMEMNENQSNPEYYFRYAQALKTVQNYEESDKWMTKFHEVNASDKRAKTFWATKDYLDKIENSSRELEVVNQEFNSDKSDFGTVQYKNQLIFASSRGEGKKYEWNEQPFLDLYYAEKQSKGLYAGDSLFSEDANTKYHESSASFTPDDKIMFFTRNNYYKKRDRKDKDGTNRLKLFRRTLQEDGTWGDEQSVHFNSDEYSVAHPSVNVHGNKIYFASDMPGTKGLSDLYVADLKADGTLGEPINLGSLINTEGQETFPFINEKGDLFFASNGYPGLGGLDIYVIRDFEKKFNSSNNNYVVENIAKPINSPYDDFAYYENLGTEEGFFSSNRPGGKGDDDIYSFNAGECKQEVVGVVKDKNTKELIPNATVTIFDDKGKEISSVLVGEDAAFNFELECGKEYLVRAEKVDYSSDEKRFTTPKTDLKLNLELGLDLSIELFLEPDTKPFKVGTDIREILGIDIIYFDFDKDNIRSPDATAELQKVILFMKTYPQVHIDVRSHTDSRASDAYNDDLSARRNRSTIDYIVNKGGISRSRLTGRGYGERELVNQCADGVKCTEAEHDLNRRSEFIITKM